jgi:hypothetical protein
MGWISYIVIICVLVAFNLFSFDSIMRMRKDIAAIRRALVPAPKKQSSPSEPAAESAESGGKQPQPESVGRSVSSVLSKMVDNIAGKGV